MKNFNLSKEAAKKIKILQKKENLNSYFRISVFGGGCSGFQYDFSFTDEKNLDDMVLNL